MTLKEKAKILSAQRKYIKKYRNYDGLEEILRCVRYILRTPEGADVIEQAEKIMQRINKKDL